MRFVVPLLAAAAVLSTGAAQAATVQIKDAVVRVTVVPEDRSDIRVEVVAPNPQLPISVSQQGDRTVIDGGLYRRIRNCDGQGERTEIRVRGLGEVGWREMPQLVIHTPRNVAIDAGGAVQGVIGRSGNLDLRNSGCSAWTVADVGGEAQIRESGAGSVRMGAARRLTVRISGAANIHATQVRESLDAELSGAGGLKVDGLQGSLVAKVSGVGQIRVADGHASSMLAHVSGVGGVQFGGSADSLDAQISGFGGIKVREVKGEIRKSVSGGGHVTIGERT